MLQEVVALPTTLAGWLLGALIGPALLALVLAARSGLRATLRPEAPLLIARAAKVVPLSTLLLWDAIACGLVMPAAILLFAIPREVWQDVGLSDVVFSAVSLALVRLLWFRGFALATLPLIATGEFTFLAAYEADTLMSFGSFSWFAAPYFGSYALLILLPLCILAAEVHQTRRNRQRMKETFE